ncbi:MAG: hypothetical protein ACQXXG_08965 [Candidatus Bathyarchaeia archaeon]
MENILEQTISVVYHEDDYTFSFVMRKGKLRISLVEDAGVESVGGLDKLFRFVEEVSSGKRQVAIDQNTLKMLLVVLLAHSL